MSINAYVYSFLPFDYHTETATAAIDEEVPGQNGKRLALIGYNILAGATAQNLHVMHCGKVAGSRTTTSAEAASGQPIIITTDAPTDPTGAPTASADIIAYQVEGGTWEFNTVSGLATNTITLNTNLATKVLSGAAVRIFGIVTDNANFAFHLTASVVNKADDTILCIAPFVSDPLYTSNPNASNDSFHNSMLFAYINK